MLHRRLIHFLALTVLAALSLPSAAAEPASYPDSLVQHALELGLDQDPYWRILVQYRPRWLGGWKSEIDARAFFNSPQGRKDPRAELEATIRAFFEPALSEAGGQHPQCRFIDRYQWLKSRLGFDPQKLPAQPCKDYDEWRKALDPESVTVVFSSYYMNNPSSMFGHTLLRLNHRNHTDQERLLDYGVNYAADSTTSNAFLYGFLGLAGGFAGGFSNIPYYLKVQEYNDLESRDLWEYDLSFGSEQIDRLMDHLWAVGRVHTSYYFLDRNCSYMLLTLLDAAEPSLRLSDDFQSVWVIPADTVRKLNSRSGLVRRVHLRPSLATRILQQRQAMTAEQIALFTSLIDARDADARAQLLDRAASAPAESAARILDLTLDYLRLLKSRQKGKLEPAQLALQQETLEKRTRIDRKPAEIVVTQEQTEHMRPDLGHNTSRVAVALGYSDLRGSFGEIGARAAFHDLNANGAGYPPSSEIELLNLQLRYYGRDQRVAVEHADLVHILSLSPLEPLSKRMSWTARLGADPVRDFDSGDQIEYEGNVGAGVSVKPLRPLTLYAMGRAELGVSGAYTPTYRLGPGALAGALYTLSDRLSLEGWASYSKPVMGYTPGYYQASTQARFSTSVETELRLQYDVTQIANQGKLVLHVYF
jgi:hypothetical protein